MTFKIDSCISHPAPVPVNMCRAEPPCQEPMVEKEMDVFEAAPQSRIPRTRQALVAQRAKEITDIDALKGVDQRLIDIIVPSKDLGGKMTFVAEPGIKARIGAGINQQLNLPEDWQSWDVEYRSDILTTGDPKIDFLFWNTINRVGDRALRQEQVHLYSQLVVDGKKKLALSRRRDDNANPEELPNKTLNRYPVTTRVITNYESEPDFMHLLRQSPRLQALVKAAEPADLQIVRTDMDKPFEIKFLKAIGARSHNYYVLNKKTGERLHEHFFKFWEWKGFTPKQQPDGTLSGIMGHYEVTDFEELPRTDDWDPTLDNGLKR